MRPLLLALVTSGCVAGGGPIVGVKLDHGGGLVYGGEAGGGVAVAQANLGFDTVAHDYLRFDASWDVAQMDPSTSPTAIEPVAHIGGGFRFDGGGVFAAGAGAARALVAPVDCHSDLFGVAVVVTYVELRLSGGSAQLVLHPRLEAHTRAPLGCT